MKKGKGITNNLQTPHMKLKSVDVDSVRWTSGLWAERFDACASATIKHLWQEMQNPHYGNFLRAVGEKEGHQHEGYGFSDGDLYKWLEAAIAVYNISRDSELERLIDTVISVIGKVQQGDGYIYTRLALDKVRGRAEARPFERAIEFETYNCGHLMTAACLHYRITGKRTLLDIAIKLSDFLCKAFAKPTPDLARFDICPSHYMGIIEMYRTTGDSRYLELGKKFIDMRDLVENGTDMNQERLPFRQQTKAVGHGVRANYLYAGAADVYAESGDESLLSALHAIWDDLVSHKLYVTGATGALNTGTSPSTHGTFLHHELMAKGDQPHPEREDKQAPRPNAVHFVQQSYGREYELPNLTGYNESCATIGSALWNWRMLQISGDAKYADLLESTLINGILSTISLDGTRYFYSNALKRSKGVPFPMRWSTERQGHIACYCCPPNIARTIAETNCYAYCVTDDAVWAVLYGANTWKGSLVNGTEVTLEQKTEYPWSGEIAITVNVAKATEFALMLRIPQWADAASLVVKSRAGKQLHKAGPEAGRFFELRRQWAPGDVVELSLPMRTRLVEGHHLLEETRGQVAVLRGPVVYCIESADMRADGGDIFDLAIPRDIELQPAKHAIAGAPVIALEGEALKYEHRDWGTDLYREVSGAPPRRAKVRMIPYFCWDNRSGSTEMAIWLPLD